jgi:hypothetical protein
MIEVVGSVGLGLTLALTVAKGPLDLPRTGLSVFAAAGLLASEAWLMASPVAAAAAVFGLVVGLSFRVGAGRLQKERLVRRQV